MANRRGPQEFARAVTWWCVLTSLTTSWQHVHVQGVSHSGSNGGPPNIAFISITTDDLDSSLKFYTQVAVRVWLWAG